MARDAVSRIAAGREPIAQWKSTGFLNLVRRFDSCSALMTDIDFPARLPGRLREAADEIEYAHAALDALDVPRGSYDLSREITYGLAERISYLDPGDRFPQKRTDADPGHDYLAER